MSVSLDILSLVKNRKIGLNNMNTLTHLLGNQVKSCNFHPNSGLHCVYLNRNKTTNHHNVKSGNISSSSIAHKACKYDAQLDFIYNRLSCFTLKLMVVFLTSAENNPSLSKFIPFFKWQKNMIRVQDRRGLGGFYKSTVHGHHPPEQIKDDS